MEKILFARVEAWVVAILLLLALIGAILFGAVVLEHSRNDQRFRTVGGAAVAVASLPRTAREIIRNRDPRIAERTDRFGDRGGWILYRDPVEAGLGGYLLLSRFDGDTERAQVELIDLASLQVRYTWRPDAEAILDGARPGTVRGKGEKWNRGFFEAVHPLLLDDGGLLVKDHDSPLVRIDRCSDRQWMQDENLYHHSTSADATGTIWAPSHIDPPSPEFGPKIIEDGIARLSLDGTVLSEVSAPQLLVRNGYLPLIFTGGGYRDDPLHLNDIEPALANGPYWQAGDLFLSFHHISAVALYRPSTDRILWLKQGPWIGQHDVDILNDHEISIFNNNAYDNGNGSRILDQNEVMIYDFATDSVRSPFRAAMKQADVMTLSEGLSDFTETGHLIVEEENSGRLLIFAPDGTLVAEFINRDQQGRIFTLGWSRYVNKAEAETTLATIARQPPCPPVGP